MTDPAEDAEIKRVTTMLSILRIGPATEAQIEAGRKAYRQLAGSVDTLALRLEIYNAMRG